MKKIIVMSVAAISANIFGWSVPIAAAVNFLWLLVKDETLFNWSVLIWLVAGFISSLICLVAAYVFIKK